jgi:hypothetical protein
MQKKELFLNVLTTLAMLQYPAKHNLGQPCPCCGIVDEGWAARSLFHRDASGMPEVKEEFLAGLQNLLTFTCTTTCDFHRQQNHLTAMKPKFLIEIPAEMC